MSKKNCWVWAAWLSAQAVAQGQTPPVDAGQLLEQQRRLEQQSLPAPVVNSPLRDGSPAPAPAKAGDTLVSVRRFSLGGNTLLGDAALQEVLRPWLMRPLTLAALRQAGAAVEQAYRDAGWLAHVVLPAQDVTDGQLRMEITEARLGGVRMAPAPVIGRAGAASAPGLSLRLSARVEALLNAGLDAGQPMALARLERALLIADELPGVSVGGSLQAGVQPGTTDVLVQAVPTPRLSGDVSLDNAANRSTGSERINASLRLSSPWGWGEQFDLAASKTRGTDYLRAAASLPVGLAGWRVGVNASALHYRVLDAFDTTTGLAPRGSSQTLGAEAQYPLVRSARARWSAALGIEERRQVNRDDNVTPGLIEVTSRARSRVVTVGVIGYVVDSLGLGGQTQAGVQAVAGRLDLAGSAAAQLAGDSLTENTQGGYQVLRWNASRLQTLTPTLALVASASGQFASRNLNSSEKLYLGGMGAVNAYPSGEAGGSSGHLIDLELRQQLGAAWQLGAFCDWGQVRQYHDNQRADGTGPLTTHNTVTLKGVGASIGWRNDNGLRLKAIWSHRIGSNPLMTATGRDSDGSLTRNRIWLMAGIAF